jgi:prephenate dehydrogenase
MGIRQITIVGTGLMGGSLGLALKEQGFRGRVVGCDRSAALERALSKGAVDDTAADPSDAVRGSDVIVLATPVMAILDLITDLGPALSARTLITDLGSTKMEITTRAQAVLGERAATSFLGGHPMAGKEQSGVEFADPELFQGAAWFVTPLPEQDVYAGISGEFLMWVERIGARTALIDAQQHDELCAWISHLPQMISTALAATLVEEFGEDAPLLEAGGRALRELTRISSSPYSMWRDIALTNRKPIADALWKVEQRLAHIRENLGSRELAVEFERAHHLRKPVPGKSARDPKKP